ncbi:MAG: hypothetical protein ACR2NT_02210 [Acidimicrobiia bacterium]
MSNSSTTPTRYTTGPPPHSSRLVGAYAVNFEFAPDSHRTGIFTFDQLRQLGSSEVNPAR